LRRRKYESYSGFLSFGKFGPEWFTLGSGEPSVNPTFFVQWPDRGRTVSLSEAANALNVQIWDSNLNRVLYGPFVVRRQATNVSNGYREQATLGQLVKPGVYRFILGSYYGIDGLGGPAGYSDTLVRIQNDGQVTDMTGQPITLRHKVEPRLVSLRLGDETQFKIGTPIRPPFIGLRDGVGEREQNTTWAEFRIEWLEGRQRLEFQENSSIALLYRGISPGIVRFRLHQDDFTSDIFQIEITP
jgi:hypothetical protein